MNNKSEETAESSGERVPVLLPTSDCQQWADNMNPDCASCVFLAYPVIIEVNLRKIIARIDFAESVKIVFL